jgi:hypothetical protein
MREMKAFLEEVTAPLLEGKPTPEPDKFDVDALPFGVKAGQNKFGWQTCPTCGKPPTKFEGTFANYAPGFLFRDTLSCTEYQISGMCQACQDGVFSTDGSK